MRERHQPWKETPKRDGRGRQERAQACGQLAACVLALDAGCEPVTVMLDDAPPAVLDAEAGGAGVSRPLQRFEGRPCAQWAVSAALEAGFGAVVVLADARVAEGVRGVLPAMPDGVQDGLPAPTVRVVPCDAHELRDRTRALHDAQLFDVPAGVLERAWEEASACLPDAQGVVFLRADNPRVTADHLFELACDAARHACVQAVASWVVWLRRLPLLVRRGFLEQLEPWAAAPLPRVQARDHLFGEERICVDDPQPAGARRFLDACGFGALQAVALAKRAVAHPGEEALAPGAPSLMSAVPQPRALTWAERELVAAAGRALDAIAEERDLAWADAFGARNRRDFPLLCDREHAGRLAYLDTAATAQRLDVALQAAADFDLHGNANVYRGAYGLSARATFAYNDARAAIEGHLAAQRRSTVLLANTTAACNLVASAWGERHIGEGDLIVTTVAEHHSAMLPFMLLAQRTGAHLEFLPLDDRGGIDQAAWRRALDAGPKLVCLAQVGNVLGIEAPVARMAAEAHGAGARVLVDAAQSFPHQAIDVGALGADWVAFSGHKAYGPLGIGGLWISSEAFDEMDPLAAGGGTVSHVSTEDYYLRPAAIQYELGTPPVSQAIGLAAAITHLDALGMDQVARHAASLTRAAAAGLDATDGVRVLGDHSQACGQHGIVSFFVRSVGPSALAGFLGALDVAVRAGGHCAIPLHASLGLVGSGRLSFGVYSTADDVAAALAAIDVCRRAFEGEWG